MAEPGAVTQIFQPRYPLDICAEKKKKEEDDGHMAPCLLEDSKSRQQNLGEEELGGLKATAAHQLMNKHHVLWPFHGRLSSSPGKK